MDLTNSDSAVGTLTVNPVVFNGGAGVAANTAFDPVSAGATTISLVQPAGFDVPANVPSSIVATVTAPNISLGNVTVGKDLQSGACISLIECTTQSGGCHCDNRCEQCGIDFNESDRVWVVTV